MRRSTRREFVQTLSASAAFAPMTAPRQPASGRPIVAYVGTYTTPRSTNHGEGVHILEKANVDGAKKYVTFFLKHPDLISWYHAVPLHIIPAQREVLLSEAYQANDVIQKRMDVLEFLDSIWGNGVPTYYWDGPELNPYVGLFENDSLGGWKPHVRAYGQAGPAVTIWNGSKSGAQAAYARTRLEAMQPERPDLVRVGRFAGASAGPNSG